MPKLPELQPETSIIPSASPDIQDSYTELGNRLNEFFGKAGHSFIKEATSEAKIKGEQLGLTDGAKIPGSSIFPAEEEERKAALQARDALINMQIKGIVHNEANNTLNNLSPDAYENFTTNVQKAKQKYMVNVPSELAQNAKFYFDSYYNQFGSTVQHYTTKLNQNIAVNGLNEYVASKTQEVAHEMALGNQDIALDIYGQIKNKLNTALESGLVSPAYVQQNEQLSFKHAQSLGYLGQFENALKGNKASQYLENFAKKSPQSLDLTDPEKLSIYSQMQSKAIQSENEQISNALSAKKSMEDAIGQVQAGAPIDSQSQTVSNIAQYYPNSYEEFGNRLNKAQLQASVVNLLQQRSPYKQQLILQGFKPKPTDANFVDDMKTWTAIGNAIHAYNKDAVKDPAKYLWQDPTVLKTIERNKVAAPNIDGGKEQSHSPYSVNVIDAYFNAAKIRGIPEDKVKLMTNAYAAEFAQRIHSLPITPNEQGGDSQLNELNALLRQFPGDNARVAILRQLNSSGVPLASLVALKASQDPNTIPLLPDYSQAMQASTSDLKTAVEAKGYEPKNILTAINSNDDYQSFMNSISNYRNMSDGAKNNILTNIQKMAEHLVGFKNQGVSAAVQNAVNMYTSGYQFDSRNGHTYRIPTDVTLNNGKQIPLSKGVIDKLYQVVNLGLMQNESKVDVPLSFQPGQTDRQAAKKDYLNNKVLGQYSFMTLPDEQHLEVIDADGAPLLVDGKPLKISFQELADPNSHFNIDPTINAYLPKMNPSMVQNPLVHEGSLQTVQSLRSDPLSTLGIKNPAQSLKDDKELYEKIEDYHKKVDDVTSRNSVNLLHSLGLDVPDDIDDQEKRYNEKYNLALAIAGSEGAL